MQQAADLRCDHCSGVKFPLMQSGAHKVYVFKPLHGNREIACSVSCHHALYMRWERGITRHWRQWARPPDLAVKVLNLERPTLVAL